MSKTATASLLAHMAGEVTTLATCFRLVAEKNPWKVIAMTSTGAGVWEVETEYPTSLVSGNAVYVENVSGVANVNDNYFTVANVSSNVFEITASALTGTYASAGTVKKTFGYTNIDKDLVVEGVTFRAATGAVPATIRVGNNTVINNTEYGTLALAQFVATEAEIHAGVMDHAYTEVFVVNHQKLSMGKMYLQTGYTGNTTFYRDNYVNEIASLADQLAQDTVEIVTPDCRNDLGDEYEGLVSTGCRVNLATYRVSSVVTSAAASSVVRRSFIDSTRAEASGYWDGGLLEWTTGDNAGTTIEVKRNAGTTITLFEDSVFQIEAGDSYRMTPGCDKTRETCIAKFSAVVDFNGFDLLPGPKEISKIGNPLG